ncbi:MAG TPA: hypothetical protein VF345_08815 [Chthoniobacterales bacterium]
MNRILSALLCGSFLCVLSSAKDTYPSGIVYGPKAAFKIDAPDGWVLDNTSGIDQGLPCVLYPKGSTWVDAKTIIYAKIASTQYTDAETFVARAIKEMEKVHGLPKQKIESGKTGDGHAFFVNEYAPTASYSQSERIAYVQLPHAVAYIVLLARDKGSYRKHAGALKEVLKSLAYLEPKLDR